MTNTTRNRAEPVGRPARAALVPMLALVLGLGGQAAPAADLSLPSNARLTAERLTGPDSYRLPSGPHADGTMPTITAEGQVSRRAWRIDAQGITTLQLLAPLRDQLEAAGYEILFECAAAECGGFDFRFALDVVPAPDMHVDLFDFRYLLARHPGAAEGKTPAYAALLTSRTANAGFVQVVQIVPPNAPQPSAKRTATATTGPAVKSDPPAPAQALPLAQALTLNGHAALGDLTFETGSANLGQGRFASLAALAAFLLADPARRVALVGHTDAVGGLDGNITLSRRRAASVLERLATEHGVPRDQMTAEGMGYLAPVTTNLTAEGREMNRRVEAVLLGTE